MNYLLGDITTMELEENEYDVILIHFVLHDIDEDIRPAIIKKLVSVLKPGGRLIIREPTSKSHGMPAEEVQNLMQSNELEERSFIARKMMFMISVIEGVYYKI